MNEHELNLLASVFQELWIETQPYIGVTKNDAGQQTFFLAAEGEANADKFLENTAKERQQREDFKKQLNSKHVKEFTEKLRETFPLIPKVAELLARELFNIYQEQLRTDIASNSLNRIDFYLPHFKVKRDSLNFLNEIEINLNEEHILRAIEELKLPLEDFFEEAGIWEKCGCWMWRNLILRIRELMYKEMDLQTSFLMSMEELQGVLRSYIYNGDPEPLSQRITYFGDIWAQGVTKVILQKLNFPRYPLNEIETLLALRKPVKASSNIVAEPPLYAHETIALFPTSVAMRASIESVSSVEKWFNNNNNYAEFRLDCTQNPNNKFHIYISESHGLDFLPLETALQVLNGLGLDAAKLQLVFGAYIARKNNPWEETIRLKGSEIIKDIGWDKRKDLNHSQKLNSLGAIAYTIGRLMTESSWVEGKGKKQIDLSSTLISPLWFLSIESIGQKNLISGKIYNPDEIIITLRAGDWASKWFNHAGTKAGESLKQFGYLAQEILRIDPYHDELALRLAIQLTMFSRIRAKDKNPYYYQVKSLLKSVQTESDLSDALTDNSEAFGLKKRWDRAVQLLVKLGWQFEFQEDYPEWLRPGSKVKKPEGWRMANGRQVKLLERIMNAHVCIKPPHPILEKLSSLSVPKQSPPKLKRSMLLGLCGEQVKNARVAKGLSQRKLTEMLSISQTQLSLIESGQRSISPKLEAELRKILDIPD